MRTANPASSAVDQQRRRRESEAAAVRAEVGMAEAGEEEREECRGERRAATRQSLVARLHRG